MMAYIDYAFYKDKFFGIEVDLKTFNRFVVRASDVIDQATNFIILEKGLSSFDDKVQLLIKKATAAQVEYYVENGIEMDYGQTGTADTVSVGKFSYSSSNQSDDRQKGRLAANSLAYLQGTGLIKSGGVKMRVI